MFLWFFGNTDSALARPFNGANTQCFLAQYFNALYVLDGDNSLPNAVHIFNFVSRSWSTLTVELNGVSHQSLVAILDRDTNVFFGLNKSTLYRLDMAQLNASDGSTRGWETIGTPPFTNTINYTQPVLALAQNHIHFLNIGQPSQADIFVIHFSYFQPEVQSYPGINGAGSFPSTHGQTASIFKGYESVQEKFAFWPDDKSSTYVIDVVVRVTHGFTIPKNPGRDADWVLQSNTTSVMSAPTDKSSSVFAASRTGLVQLTTGGDLYGMTFSPDNSSANAQETWKKIVTPKLTFGPSKLQQSAPLSSGTDGTATAAFGRASDAVSDAGARLMLSWGMAVAGLVLSAIGLAQ